MLDPQQRQLSMEIRHEPQADFYTLLDPHREILRDRVVLDLGCHTGVSSRIMRDMGARLVLGVDQDADAIQQARDHMRVPGVEFAVQDLERTEIVGAMVDFSNTVVTFGTLYHLNRHHDLLRSVARPHIEHVIIDTLYGPESEHTQVWCHFESNFFNEPSIIPKYVPNLAWLITQMAVWDFALDHVQKYYTTTNFAKVTDPGSNMRMTARFFNQNIFPHRAGLASQQVWAWRDQDLLQHT